MSVRRISADGSRSLPFEMWLVLAGIGALAAYVIVQRILLTGQVSPYLQLIGVPLDDVYIHTRFAQNLLHGFSYSFNPGQTLTSDTSPLWVLLIAFGGIFTSRLELVAIAISMIAYLGIGPGVYRASRDVFGISEGHARIAGLAAVLSSRLTWSGMSGMETALAALLSLLLVEEHERSRARNCPRPREALWLGLGILVRPEFMFFAVILIGDWVIFLARNPQLSKVLPFARNSITLLITLAAPAFLLPLTTRGSLVSFSSVVQGAQLSFVPNVVYLWFAAKIIASNNVILFLLFVWGLYALRNERNFRALYIIAIGLPLLQAFVAPQFRQSGRYFFPVLPLVVIAGTAAWERLHWHPKIIPFLIVLAGLIETGRWAMISAESVRNINDQQLAVVGWLKQNMQPTDTVAVDDVGAVGYFLNTPVIDLTGLMTPSIWERRRSQDSVWRQARASGANLFVIYNRLNLPFYEDHKDSLLLIQSFSVRLPLASSADTTMSIYRVNTNAASR